MAKTTEKPQVHFFLQAKGGVGKSFLSARLMEYLASKELDVLGIDVDPKNRSLMAYKGLKVKEFPIMDGDDIRNRRFDELIELILSEPRTYVVDNGTSSVVAMQSYFKVNNILELLAENKIKVYLHCILAGSGSLSATINDCQELFAMTSQVNMVLWNNEFFGELGVREKPNSPLVRFEETELYASLKEKIIGEVLVAKRGDDSTFGEDARMLAQRTLTYREAIADPEINVVARQRIKTLKNEVFEQLDAISF